MERDKALDILKALADGNDPSTGKPFPANSSYQHPDTVRALYFAVQALESPVRPQADGEQHEEQSSRNRDAARRQHENAGRPWSEEEEVRLGQAFDAGKTILELAEDHKRSRIAIEARLVKLGKIEAPQSGTMRYPVRGRGGAASGASESAPLTPALSRKGRGRLAALADARQDH